METIATIIAGLVLAGAATAGVIATQADKPAGELPAGGAAPVTQLYDVRS